MYAVCNLSFAGRHGVFGLILIYPMDLPPFSFAKYYVLYIIKSDIFLAYTKKILKFSLNIANIWDRKREVLDRNECRAEP